MSDLPSLSAIRVFEAAARHSSFKEAAVELHLTPTAISHQIRALEEWMGERLFDRRTREVVLTDAGRHLSKAASKSFNMLRQSVAELKRTHNNITVSTTSSFAALWLIPKLADFNARHPDIAVDIRTGEHTDEHRHRPLETGQISIRFGSCQGRLETQILKREHYNLYASSQVWEAAGRNEQVTVFLTRWKNPAIPPQPWEAWMELHPESVKNFRVHVFDQELYGIQQALAGKGIVFSSQTLVSAYKEAGLLQPYTQDSLASELCYYLPESEAADRVQIRQFYDWLTITLANG